MATTFLIILIIQRRRNTFYHLVDRICSRIIILLIKVFMPVSLIIVDSTFNLGHTLRLFVARGLRYWSNVIHLL